MTALYNEIDPKAAAWLRELIRHGLIAPGDVLEASIEDLTPNDLKPYTQVHFFAGIGVWSYALRQAGWPDDRPVWTGSCPCQPFSAAGKKSGFDDERHLWPAFHWLIDQCRPDVVLGEQVASKDGLGWLDLVQADLEGSGYASGAVDLCAAGVGAPHIRQRLWWFGERLAHSESDGPIRGRKLGEPPGWPSFTHSGAVGGLADSDSHEPWSGRDGGSPEGKRLWPQPSGRGNAGRLAKHSSEGLEGRDTRTLGRKRQTLERNGGGEPARQPATSPTNGLWADADWLFCRDGKWRPVEPGTFPLAYGAPARVGRLRGYGNAIVAPAAQAFIEAYLEARTDGSFSVTAMSHLSLEERATHGVFA